MQQQITNIPGQIVITIHHLDLVKNNFMKTLCEYNKLKFLLHIFLLMKTYIPEMVNILLMQIKVLF